MISILMIFVSFFAWSKIDLNAGFQGRTLPALGAEIYADAGYNQLIWGKKENPKDILYGLIRPSFSASSSGVINSLKTELEIFPISILGFSTGRQLIHSNYDFPFFDCQTINCQGEFHRNYIESKMVLGAAGWIILGNYKIDTLTGPADPLPMADWRNVIVGLSRRDTQIEKKLLLGKSFADQFIGILAENVQFQGSNERKESYAAVYQFRKQETNYMIGVGPFHTDREPMGIIFYFRMHYILLPSLKLF